MYHIFYCYWALYWRVIRHLWHLDHNMCPKTKVKAYLLPPERAARWRSIRQVPLRLLAKWWMFLRGQIVVFFAPETETESLCYFCYERRRRLLCLEDKRAFLPFLARAYLIYRQHYVHLLQQYCILKHQADICFLENVSVVVGKGLFPSLLRNWFFYSFLWQFRAPAKDIFCSLMGFTLLVLLVIPLLFFFLKVFIFHFSTRFIALH